MAGVVRISEMVSLALHSMVIIAASLKEIINVKEISAATGCSEAHLVKTLQRLVRAGLVYSIRGPKGGFGLAKSPDEITMLDIFQAIEGPLSDGKCPMNHQICSFHSCILGGMPKRLNQEFADYLAGQKLSDLTGNFKGFRD